METGTCSLRSAFRNGSCNSCPLLLIANSVVFLQVGSDWDEEKEIRRQSLHYSRFSVPNGPPSPFGQATRPLRQPLSAYGFVDERNSIRNGVPVNEKVSRKRFSR